jgi:hypothetical protein
MLLLYRVAQYCWKYLQWAAYPLPGTMLKIRSIFTITFWQQGAFIDAGNFSEEAIRNALFNVIDEPKQLKTIIDGKSTDRLKGLFKLLDDCEAIHLKHARGEDIGTTFRWACDAG